MWIIQSLKKLRQDVGRAAPPSVTSFYGNISICIVLPSLIDYSMACDTVGMDGFWYKLLKTDMKTRQLPGCNKEYEPKHLIIYFSEYLFLFLA